MNQIISKFVSNTTYNGQLKAHPSVAHHLLAGLSPTLQKYSMSRSEEELRKSVLMNPFIYIDTKQTCLEEKNAGMVLVFMLVV